MGKVTALAIPFATAFLIGGIYGSYCGAIYFIFLLFGFYFGGGSVCIAVYAGNHSRDAF